ncbi:CAMK protein kinase [Fonticula alba]|uniref:CAMK protein kinase n=1 Tax=Fonticula alba TaxID=691883 RepID=A0A058ZCX0_FONAL|nr:CAMK protein kinase [Fonticula alba]KCV72229.1 CAMK protein kinase [Fonticula alba]|eukprot:XP_009493807.1 CAMK protein kinase [Fonticula alba]
MTGDAVSATKRPGAPARPSQLHLVVPVDPLAGGGCLSPASPGPPGLSLIEKARRHAASAAPGPARPKSPLAPAPPAHAPSDNDLPAGPRRVALTRSHTTGLSDFGPSLGADDMARLAEAPAGGAAPLPADVAIPRTAALHQGPVGRLRLADPALMDAFSRLTRADSQGDLIGPAADLTALPGISLPVGELSELENLKRRAAKRLSVTRPVSGLFLGHALDQLLVVESPPPPTSPCVALAAAQAEKARRRLSLPGTKHIPLPAFPPDFLERYEIVRVLGFGAYAEVYEAVERTPERRRFAVKVVFTDRIRNRRRLDNEIAAMKAAGYHPGMICLRETISHGRFLLLRTDLARGGTLFDVLIDHGGFGEALTSRIMRNLFEAVDFIHNIPLIHRDIKLENILIADPNDPSSILLCDFGVVRALTDEEFAHFHAQGETSPLLEPAEEGVSTPISDDAETDTEEEEEEEEDEAARHLGPGGMAASGPATRLPLTPPGSSESSPPLGDSPLAAGPGLGGGGGGSGSHSDGTRSASGPQAEEALQQEQPLQEGQCRSGSALGPEGAEAPFGDQVVIMRGKQSAARAARRAAYAKSQVGSLDYMPPEVFIGDHAHGPPFDVWSCGVVLFMMLSLTSPFGEDYGPGGCYHQPCPKGEDLPGEQGQLRRIIRCQYHYGAPAWRMRSPESMDLISRLLVKDPAERLTASEALAHPWITNPPPGGSP